MKKAVFIINSLQNGGAERVVATQANYLSAKGIDVTVIFFRKWVQYQLQPQIHTIYLTDVQKFSAADYAIRLLPLAWKLHRILKKILRDGEIVLMTSNLLYPDIITRLSGYSRQTVFVLHNYQEIVPWSGKLFYQLFMHWLYGGQKLICVGELIEEELRTVYHLKQKTIKSIWNPLDFELIDQKKEEVLDYTSPYILLANRLTEVKHPERIIDAFYKGMFYKEYHLVILGEGELKDKLKEMTQNYGIESCVHFGGWETNVYKWMTNAVLFVLCSDVEGLPMVLLEALYCGCPVVAVKNHGSQQILKGELREYLCDPNVEEIVEKMKKALKYYPKDLQKYTENSSIEKSLENYMTAYNEWNVNVKAR